MLEKINFLSAAENRATFFRRINVFLPTLDPRYKMIEKAYNCAKDAFRDKNREGGERYFEHLRAVTLILIDYLRITDYKIIVAALLHDIIEDIPSWTVERIEAEFNGDVALLVEWLTKPGGGLSKEQSDKIYHERFRFAPREFFLIKLSDRLHNVMTLWSCSREKRLKKIQETKTFYLPYAEKELILFHELREAIASLELEGKSK